MFKAHSRQILTLFATSTSAVYECVHDTSEMIHKVFSFELFHAHTSCEPDDLIWQTDTLHLIHTKVCALLLRHIFVAHNFICMPWCVRDFIRYKNFWLPLQLPFRQYRNFTHQIVQHDTVSHWTCSHSVWLSVLIVLLSISHAHNDT